MRQKKGQDDSNKHSLAFEVSICDGPLVFSDLLFF